VPQGDAVLAMLRAEPGDRGGDVHRRTRKAERGAGRAPEHRQLRAICSRWQARHSLPRLLSQPRREAGNARGSADFSGQPVLRGCRAPIDLLGKTYEGIGSTRTS
jgi:hypothetical protein